MDQHSAIACGSAEELGHAQCRLPVDSVRAVFCMTSTRSSTMSTSQHHGENNNGGRRRRRKKKIRSKAPRKKSRIMARSHGFPSSGCGTRNLCWTEPRGANPPRCCQWRSTWCCGIVSPASALPGSQCSATSAGMLEDNACEVGVFQPESTECSS